MAGTTIDVSDAWDVRADGLSIERSVKVKDFVTAVKAVDAVAVVAEGLDHHPDIHLTGWNNVRFVCSTHSEGRLTEKDEVLARKIDEIIDGLS